VVMPVEQREQALCKFISDHFINIYKERRDSFYRCTTACSK
jgi:hypothetical protein